MNYMSVCSGIEAASVAWESLGWTAVAFSEIEEFPCAVLRHRFPTVPNLGDMTKFHEWPDFSIDLLVGGCPCQAFSIAGLREGLNDPRGNLTLTFLGVVEKYKPRRVVYENVPGLLTDKTNALCIFLDGLERVGYAITGFDILDAQFHGLAQRRRRIFVCAQRVDSLLQEKTAFSGLIAIQCLAEIWQNALAVQFEQLNLGPEKWGLESSSHGRSLKKRIELFSLQKAEQAAKLLGCLDALLPLCECGPEGSEFLHGNSYLHTDNQGAMSCEDVVSKTENIDGSWSIGPSWRRTLEEALVMASGCITSTATSETTASRICIFAQALLNISKFTLRLKPSLENFSHAAASCFAALNTAIKYARPTSTEIYHDLGRLRWWDDFREEAKRTATAIGHIGVECSGKTFPVSESMSGNPPPSRSKGKDVARTIAARTTGGGGLGTDFDLAGGLQASVGGADENDARDGRLVAQRTHPGLDWPQEIAPTLNAHFGDKQGLEDQHINGGADSSFRVAGTLTSRDYKSVRMDADTNHLIVGRTGGFFDGAIPILEAGARTGNSTTDPRAGMGVGDPGDPMFTLQRGKQHAIAFSSKDYGGDAGPISPTLRAGGHTTSHANAGAPPAVAFDWNAQVDQMNFDSNTAPTLTRSQEPAVGPIGVGAIRADMSVRRLTPVECERLQGFPDGHTSIPGKHRPRKAEDKAETITYLVGGHGLTTEEAVALADCPDGPRYKAIGNSMAVPVMKWIGQRIAMVDAELSGELILS